VKADNPRIMDFNRRLGYRVVGEKDYFVRLQVTREEYYDRAGVLRKMAEKLIRPKSH
jgi:hypothetical protein